VLTCFLTYFLFPLLCFALFDLQLDSSLEHCGGDIVATDSVGPFVDCFVCKSMSCFQA
jgi:hypothetical protein